MEYIPAKGDYDPYLLKRYGVKVGLKKDVLSAFSAYANKAVDVLGSEPLRQANMIKNFLARKAEQEPDSPVDYVYLSKALDRFAKEYANRPVLFDRLLSSVQYHLSVGMGKLAGRLGAKPQTQRAIAEIFKKRDILNL